MSLSSTFSAALVAACLISVAVGDITIGFQNTVVYAGNPITISCQATVTGLERVQIFEYSTNPNGAQISDGDQLLSGHPNFLRYALSVDDVGGEYFLTIQTLAQDAGIYECRDITQIPSTIPRRAQLVILNSRMNYTTTLPTSGIVLRGNQFTAECRSTYSGVAAPYIEWTGTQPYSQAYLNSTAQGWGGLSFTADAVHDATAFTCRLSFTAQGFASDDPNMATNVPTLTETATTGLVFVQWAPFNISYSPVQLSYEIGQFVTCNADGFPNPTFTWYDLVIGTPYYSQRLTFTASMVGLKAFRCEAANSISTANLYQNMTINPITTTTTPGPTTTTPTIPPIAQCDPLDGRWEYRRDDGSVIALCFHYDSSIPLLYGLVVNNTNADPFGTLSYDVLRDPTYREFGVTTLYAGAGVGAFAGECRKCTGVEHMLVSGVSRNSLDALFCNIGSELIPSPTMTFFRVPPSSPCPSSTTQWQQRIAKDKAARLV